MLKHICGNIGRSASNVAVFRQHFSSNIERPAVILGIESTCDDTGCAIVNSNRVIHGHVVRSQEAFHLRSGGINPVIAKDFHRQNIRVVVNECLAESNLTMDEIDAVAVANRPGIITSLLIGVRYARHLARKYSKPLIPVNHMEAHALTARLSNDIEFPFLCLLASGGHCQLLFVKNVNEFCLLGEAIDNPPGECFDKVARYFQLHNMPEFRNMNGGRAIEVLASRATNPDRFEFPSPMTKYRNCKFSFGGLRTVVQKKFQDIDKELNETSIPHIEDLCAAYLKTVTKHMLQRTQRAIQYCERKGFLENAKRSIVFSGGVACNDYIFTAISQLGEQNGFNSFRPLKNLCRDNGVMIAWNGIERWTNNSNLYKNLEIDSVQPCTEGSFASDLMDDVENAAIGPTRIKIPLFQKTTKLEN